MCTFIALCRFPLRRFISLLIRARDDLTSSLVSIILTPNTRVMRGYLLSSRELEHAHANEGKLQAATFRIRRIAPSKKQIFALLSFIAVRFLENREAAQMTRSYRKRLRHWSSNSQRKNAAIIPTMRNSEITFFHYERI